MLLPDDSFKCHGAICLKDPHYWYPSSLPIQLWFAAADGYQMTCLLEVWHSRVAYAVHSDTSPIFALIGIGLVEDEARVLPIDCGLDCLMPETLTTAALLLHAHVLTPMVRLPPLLEHTEQSIALVCFIAA